MSLRLSVCIQAHISRKEAAENLRETLQHQRQGHPSISSVDIAWDTVSAGAWASNKLAWEKGLALGADYHLVVQDDVVPCADFLPTVEYLTTLRHIFPMQFFSTRDSQIKAFEQGKRWIETRWVFGPAVAFPNHLISPMLKWIADNEVGYKDYWGTADDTRITAFLKARKYRIYETCPSLVEHPVDDPNSTAAKSLYGSRRKVFGRWAKARIFIGPSGRGLDLDWTAGLNDPVKAR